MKINLHYHNLESSYFNYAWSEWFDVYIVPTYPGG